MKTYRDICDQLDACRSAADLRQYAADLYASGLLDESEQTGMIGPRGPMAPWSCPAGSTIVDESNGEDITIELASGQTAMWRNRDREWQEVDN